MFCSYMQRFLNTTCARRGFGSCGPSADKTEQALGAEVEHDGARRGGVSSWPWAVALQQGGRCPARSFSVSERHLPEQLVRRQGQESRAVGSLSWSLLSRGICNVTCDLCVKGSFLAALLRSSSKMCAGEDEQLP